MLRLRSKGFLHHMATGRWLAALGSFFIMAFATSNSFFPLYSRDLKKSLQLNQQRLNLVSTCKELGSNLSILSGFVHRIRPTWLVLVMGCMLHWFGYLLIWLWVSGKIGKPGLWEVCISIVLATSSTLFTNRIKIVSEENFPQNRSVLARINSGYCGLGGLLLSILYFIFYGDDETDFIIMFMASVPAITSIFFLFSIREREILIKEGEQTTKVMYQILCISISMAIALMVTIVLQQHLRIGKTGYAWSLGIASMFMFTLFVLTIRGDYSDWQQSESVQRTETQFQQSPEREPFFQGFFNIEMGILLVTSLVGTGSTTLIDNMGQIGEALQYEPKSVTTFLSIASICSFSANISCLWLSDCLLRRYGVPRPVILSGVLFLSCIGCISVAYPYFNSVYVASLLAGFTQGAQSELSKTILAEIFGLTRSSLLLRCVQLITPFGSFIMNTQLTGRLYDREAQCLEASNKDVSSTENSTTCIGETCYGLSFTVLSVATFVGALLSLVLALRTREFYKADVHKTYKKRHYVKFVQDKPEKTETAGGAN